MCDVRCNPASLCRFVISVESFAPSFVSFPILVYCVSLQLQICTEGTDARPCWSPQVTRAVPTWGLENRSLEVSTARLQSVKSENRFSTEAADRRVIRGRDCPVAATAPHMGTRSGRHLPFPYPSSNISRHPQVPPLPGLRTPAPASPSFVSYVPAMRLSLSLVSSPWHKLRSKAKHLARKPTNR